MCIIGNYFFSVARLIVMIESVIFCLQGRGLISDNRTIEKSCDGEHPQNVGHRKLAAKFGEI